MMISPAINLDFAYHNNLRKKPFPATQSNPIGAFLPKNSDCFVSFAGRMSSAKNEEEKLVAYSQALDVFRETLKPEYKKLFLENMKELILTFAREDQNGKFISKNFIKKPKAYADIFNSLNPIAAEAVELCGMFSADLKTVKQNASILNKLNNKVLLALKEGSLNLFSNPFAKDKNSGAVEFLNSLEENELKKFYFNEWRIVDILNTKNFDVKNAKEKVEVLKNLELENMIISKLYCNIIASQCITKNEIIAYHKLYKDALEDSEKYGMSDYYGGKKASIKYLFSKNNGLMWMMRYLSEDELKSFIRNSEDKEQFFSYSALVHRLFESYRGFLDKEILHQKDMSADHKLGLIFMVVDEQYNALFERFPEKRTELISYASKLGLVSPDFIATVLSNKLVDENAIKLYKKLKDTVFLDPLRYAQNNRPEKANLLFDEYPDLILNKCTFMDYETLQYALTKRYISFVLFLLQYSNRTSKFDEDKKLIKQLSTVKGADGNKLSASDKYHIITLMSCFKCDCEPTKKIASMIENGTVDTEEVKNIVSETLNKLLFAEEESKYIKFQKLSFPMFNSLAQELFEADEKLFARYKDIFENFSKSKFEKFIHNTENTYGQTNSRTKTLFEQNGINYEKWCNPSADNNVAIFDIKSSTAKLQNKQNIIVEDIETLRKNSYLKKLIDKIYAQNIVDDKFVLPHGAKTSAAATSIFLNHFMSNMKSKFELAQKNQNSANPIIKERSKRTIEIEKHLKNLQADLKSSEFKNSKAEKNCNIKIKMWERKPSKDLFQGNYSTCCLGMGECNSWSMPLYLMNDSFNMLELVDNDSNKTFANALLFLAKDENGKLAVVVDAIEVNHSAYFDEDASARIRQAVLQYCKKLMKEVAPNKASEVLLCTKNNDICVSGLEKTTRNLELLGDMGNQEFYADIMPIGKYFNSRLRFDMSVLPYEVFDLG